MILTSLLDSEPSPESVVLPTVVSPFGKIRRLTNGRIVDLHCACWLRTTIIQFLRRFPTVVSKVAGQRLVAESSSDHGEETLRFAQALLSV